MDDDSKMPEEGRKVSFKQPVQHRVCQSDIRIDGHCCLYPATELRVKTVCLF